MKIEIKNYNNLKSLSYEIQDNKINFLVGISGCGKSSIANALTNNDLDGHTPFGTINNPVVKVDGKNSKIDDFELFDIDYMKGVLIDKTKGSDIYNIIVSNYGELETIKIDYINSIEPLLIQKERIQSLLYKINELIKGLNIKYKKDDTYAATCSIDRLVKNIENNTNSYIKGKQYNSARVKWFNDGKNTEEYSNSSCPFCNKKLSNSRKSLIEKITIFDSKTYETINSKSGLLEDLKINEPNWLNKKEVNSFNKKIRMHYDIKKELENILDYIHIVSKIDISINTFKVIKPSKYMKELYPEIYQCIDDFNVNYSNVRKKLGILKKNTDKIISANVKEINNLLDTLGIQYRFKKMSIDEENKNASYIIKHNRDDVDSDRVNNLSFGEKNIIGLILFLISHKNKKCLIIDDPASSYDEYRRKVIFDMLYDLKKEDTTMLVLSHDQVFAKYAIYHKESALEKHDTKKSKLDYKFIEFTGNVDYIETYKDVTIIPINREDFDSMTNFIKVRLNELEPRICYETAINLRLYYEINKAKKYHKHVYGYLSAILHRKCKSEIIEELQKYNRTEEEIVNIISNDTGIDYSLLSDSYLNNSSVENLNIFEKLIYVRDEIKSSSGQGKVIKNELSNIIHLNLAYAVCLNPYKFNYFSKYVYEYVFEKIKINIYE